MPEAKGRDMRLKIVACRHVYTGMNKRGDSYTIYEIDAERASDGHRITEKLRSFQALPIGQVVDVTVTPFKSDRYGRSFTLALKGRTSGAAAQQNDLREQVDDLRERVAYLGRRVTEVEGRVGTEVMKPQEPRAQAAQEELDRRFGADPPGGAQW